ncbi:hypothetical protein ACLOJK_019005 [Asimina triloba]
MSLLVVESLRNWDTAWLLGSPWLGWLLADIDLVMLLTELAGSGPLTKMGAMVDAAVDRDPNDVSQMVSSAADGRIDASCLLADLHGFFLAARLLGHAAMICMLGCWPWIGHPLDLDGSNASVHDRWSVAAPFVDGVGLLPSSLPHSMADRDQLGGFLPWAALDDGDRMRRTSDRAGSEMKTLLPFFWMGPIGRSDPRRSGAGRQLVWGRWSTETRCSGGVPSTVHMQCI